MKAKNQRLIYPLYHTEILYLLKTYTEVFKIQPYFSRNTVIYCCKFFLRFFLCCCCLADQVFFQTDSLSWMDCVIDSIVCKFICAEQETTVSDTPGLLNTKSLRYRKQQRGAHILKSAFEKIFPEIVICMQASDVQMSRQKPIFICSGEFNPILYAVSRKSDNAFVNLCTHSLQIVKL